MTQAPLAVGAGIAFLAIFPFLYVWLAKVSLLRKGVSLLYSSGKPMVHKAVDLVVERTASTQTALLKNKGRLEDAHKYAAEVGGEMPGMMQNLLGSLLSKVPILGIIAEVQDTLGAVTGDLGALQQNVRGKVDEHIEQKILTQSPAWFWLLVVVNVGLAVAAWIFLA